jgi:hypothetical protein
VNWIEMAQDGVQWQDFVIIAMNLWILQKRIHFD